MTIFYLNVLRLLAIFFVVFLHTNSHFLNNLTNLNTTKQIILIFFDSISRFCVPMFFLISGALLLDKKEKINVFYVKRLKKIILPFLFWCFFYYFWAQKSLTINWDILLSWLNLPYYHLWFIHALLVVYLIVPFFKKFLKLSFVFQIIFLLLLTITTLVYFYYFPDSKKFVISFFYSLYFLWGYFLKKIQLKRKKVWILLLLLIFTFQTFLFYQNFQITNWIENYYREYFSIFVFFASLIIFLLIKSYFKNFNKKSFFNKLINYLQKSVFFVYFIHIFILEIFWILNFDVFNIPLIIKIPFFSFFTLLISFGLIIFIKKFFNLAKNKNYSKIIK